MTSKLADAIASTRELVRSAAALDKAVEGLKGLTDLAGGDARANFTALLFAAEQVHWKAADFEERVRAFVRAFEGVKGGEQ